MADLAERTIHWSFYILILLQVATGFVTAFAADLPAIVFGSSGDPLPQPFSAYPIFTAHWILATILIATIVTHLAVALLR